ncbi:BTAD domain-containing putative transcriptional regulator [Streptomyces sp. NPDC006638]|uniref:AfsR/SARP family transcriptional regulator n=1 Tax=Streptomyces sp. NPDC006638 TaxID=3157183 RepID=UPI0033A63506
MTDGIRAAGIRFELLGPLRALRPDGDVPLGPPLQRSVLAVLLHQDGGAMPYDALVDAVWGAEPPSRARALVQKYVSGLRHALAFGPGAGKPGAAPELAWTGRGYRLAGATIDDLRERHALLRTAGEARASGDLRSAGDLAARAESLWRGAYAEGLAGPYLEAERRRWAEERAREREARLAVEIERGRARECVAELTRLVATHPLREPLAGLLVLALDRAGRPSAALAAYEEARTRIAEATSTEPGQALRARYEEVLRGTPTPLPGSTPAA